MLKIKSTVTPTERPDFNTWMEGVLKKRKEGLDFIQHPVTRERHRLWLEGKLPTHAKRWGGL
ncbi:MAG: hypothetical protein LC109_12440 [Bacteroidia bacterium]|nr:hypothetical protein [Bacteroidia bacterium]